MDSWLKSSQSLSHTRGKRLREKNEGARYRRTREAREERTEPIAS